MTVPDPSAFRFEKKVPDGDDVARHVCASCGWIHYVNPKIVVGAIVVEDGRFLLCRRAIEPRRGYWTMPAGYLEERETTEEGARREAREEACADIRIHDLLAIYNVPRISQVQLIYRAELASGGVAPGPESEEVKFVAWDDIPWEELAFPSVLWALTQYRSVEDQAVISPFTNPDGELGDLETFRRRSGS